MMYWKAIVTYSATVQPGGENVDTRSKNVNDGAVVREGGEAVRAVGGTDGVDGSLGCRRRIGSINSFVTSGNSHEDTSRDSIGGSRVNCGRARSTKGHVGNSAVGAASGLSIVGNIVDASNDTRVGALPTVSLKFGQKTRIEPLTEPWALSTLTA